MAFPKALRFLPLAELGLASLTLAALWGRLPLRWVVHTDANGTPNGWVVKTPLSAGGLLLIGGAAWLFGELVLWLRAGGEAPEETDTTTVSVRLIVALVSTLLCFLALALPLWGTGLPSVFYLLIPAVFVAGLITAKVLLG